MEFLPQFANIFDAEQKRAFGQKSLFAPFNHFILDDKRSNYYRDRIFMSDPESEIPDLDNPIFSII